MYSTKDWIIKGNTIIITCFLHSTDCSFIFLMQRQSSSNFSLQCVNLVALETSQTLDFARILQIQLALSLSPSPPLTPLARLCAFTLLVPPPSFLSFNQLGILSTEADSFLPLINPLIQSFLTFASHRGVFIFQVQEPL